MSHLLGGPLAPIGCGIGAVDAPLDTVAEEIARWRLDTGQRTSLARVDDGFPGCLHWLEPLEEPASRELLVDHHSGRFTIYTNNHATGGEPGPIVGAIAARLNKRAIVAAHQPMVNGASLTELTMFGPQGEPPLHLIRSIRARCTDGVWEWHMAGMEQEFEDASAYENEDIGQRLTRDRLLTYLAALGIDADDDGAFGTAKLITLLGLWRRRTVTLEQAQFSWGPSGPPI